MNESTCDFSVVFVDAPDPKGAFKVVMASHVHDLDEAPDYEYGTLATLAAAIATAQRIVDECLMAVWQPRMTADDLYRQYMTFGDDPHIVSSPSVPVPFSARDHAKARCGELCGS